MSLEVQIQNLKNLGKEFKVAADAVPKASQYSATLGPIIMSVNLLKLTAKDKSLSSERKNLKKELQQRLADLNTDIIQYAHNPFWKDQSETKKEAAMNRLASWSNQIQKIKL